MAVSDSTGKTEAFLQLNGTGAAKAKSDVMAGNQQIHVEHFFFGEFDIRIFQQYKHLGLINAGPHKYDQEVESRTAQAKASTKALRSKLCARQGIPRKQRSTVWKATILSKLVFHSATWGYNDS